MLAVLVCCLCFLTACGPAKLENNPDKNLEAFGNGGLAVVKGEYLYYVNGYQDYTEFTDVRKDNKYGDIVRSGIYRTKLVNGKVARDENGFLEDTECVVSHCVGFDKGGFYIVGDYIYYLTPHMENARDENNEKVLKNDWVDICRINIDGTNQKRLAYTTEDDRINAWAVYTIDGKPYVVLHDGTKIVSVDGENGNAVTMAENVASAVLLEQENFTYGEDNLADGYKYVYYTREYTEDDAENGQAGNKLCRVEIGKTEEDADFTICDITNNYELLDFVNGRLYYSKVKDSSTGSWVKSVYRKAITAGATEEYVCGDYTTYLFLDNQDDSSLTNNVIVVDSNKYMYLIVNGDRSEPIYKASADITFIGADDGKVYFVQEEAIYALDYITADSTPVKLSNSDKTYMLDNSNMIDLDGRRLFVMVEYKAEDETTHYYLNVIDRYDTESESQFVGEFKENETPAEPEEPEDTEDEEEQEKELWVK